jgi:sugar phosphate isomerase/epimerase
MTQPITNLDRLCIHTITTKPWSLEQSLAAYKAAGVPAVTVWRSAYADTSPETARKILDNSGLATVSLCRGGFFPAETATARQQAIDDNKRIIDEAATIGASLVVLVCGAIRGISLPDQRKQIADAIHAILPHAKMSGIKLAIEPLHPMYAGDRSAINTMAQANDIVEQINHPNLGIAVDVYHLWWDPTLEQEIARAGKNIFAYHVCDWRTPTRDLLNDRALMGEGCIPLKQIRAWVEQAGFKGFIEVEIFSDDYWLTDQNDFLKKITEAYLTHV